MRMPLSIFLRNIDLQLITEWKKRICVKIIFNKCETAIILIATTNYFNKISSQMQCCHLSITHFTWQLNICLRIQNLLGNTYYHTIHEKCYKSSKATLLCCKLLNSASHKLHFEEIIILKGTINCILFLGISVR